MVDCPRPLQTSGTANSCTISKSSTQRKPQEPTSIAFKLFLQKVKNKFKSDFLTTRPRAIRGHQICSFGRPFLFLVIDIVRVMKLGATFFSALIWKFEMSGIWAEIERYKENFKGFTSLRRLIHLSKVLKNKNGAIKVNILKENQLLFPRNSITERVQKEAREMGA